jgi:hypothetical protein
LELVSDLALEMVSGWALVREPDLALVGLELVLVEKELAPVELGPALEPEPAWVREPGSASNAFAALAALEVSRQELPIAEAEVGRPCLSPESPAARA